MKSRVHPKYKTKYCVENWVSYDRAFVRRGDVTRPRLLAIDAEEEENGDPGDRDVEPDREGPAGDALVACEVFA